MNCREFRDHLAAGGPLDNSAAEHIQHCAPCCEMVGALNRSERLPDGLRLEAVRRQILGSLKPVKPLPSDWVMAMSALLFFIAFSVAAALPFGYRGFGSLDAMQKSLYYVTIGLLGLLFSAGTVQELVPGAKRRIKPGALVAGTLLSLSFLEVLLFRTFDFTDFVKAGLPCLGVGTIVAAASGLLGFTFIRKGYFVSPVQGGVIVGCFAGLSGVAVLALACPIQDAGHSIVWHLGVLVIGTAVGSALAKLSTVTRAGHSISQVSS